MTKINGELVNAEYNFAVAKVLKAFSKKKETVSLYNMHTTTLEKMKENGFKVEKKFSAKYDVKVPNYGTKAYKEIKSVFPNDVEVNVNVFDTQISYLKERMRDAIRAKKETIYSFDSVSKYAREKLAEVGITLEGETHLVLHAPKKGTNKYKVLMGIPLPKRDAKGHFIKSEVA